MSINTFLFLLKNRKTYLDKIRENGSKFPKIAMTFNILVGTLFPTHYSALDVIYVTKVTEDLRAQKDIFFGDLGQNNNDEEEEASKEKYCSVKQAIQASEDEKVKRVNHCNTNSLIETLFEIIPSAVLMTILWLMSYTHPALRTFLEDTLTNQFSNAYMTIIILMSLKTTLGCICAVVGNRNAKRLPLSQGLFGLIIQLLMVVVLFFPKLMLISIALAYVPYIYPGLMVVEYLMIISYNRVFFGSFFRKYFLSASSSFSSFLSFFELFELFKLFKLFELFKLFKLFQLLLALIV